MHVARILFLHIIPIENQSINVLKRLNDLRVFLKLKRPSFGNIYVHRGIINLTCIVVAVDSRCVWGCVRLGWRVARSTLRVVSHHVGWPFC